MLKKLAVAAFVAVASLSCGAVGYAEDFPATPINHGAPTNLPGESLIPGMTQAMQVVNAVTQPILQPILAPGGDQPMMAPPPVMRHHRMMVHHMSRKAMMRKKMMMKKAA